VVFCLSGKLRDVPDLDYRFYAFVVVFEQGGDI